MVGEKVNISQSSIQSFHVTSCCPPTWLLLYINAINIHLCKRLVYIIVHNGFSMNWSIHGFLSAWWVCLHMMCVTALNIQVTLRNPTALLEDSMTLVKTLYRNYLSLTIDGEGSCRTRLGAVWAVGDWWSHSGSLRRGTLWPCQFEGYPRSCGTPGHWTGMSRWGCLLLPAQKIFRGKTNNKHLQTWL